jgi:hypothetical protein
LVGTVGNSGGDPKVAFFLFKKINYENSIVSFYGNSISHGFTISYYVLGRRFPYMDMAGNHYDLDS